MWTDFRSWYTKMFIMPNAAIGMQCLMLNQNSKLKKADTPKMLVWRTKFGRGVILFGKLNKPCSSLFSRCSVHFGIDQNCFFPKNTPFELYQVIFEITGKEATFLFVLASLLMTLASLHRVDFQEVMKIFAAQKGRFRCFLDNIHFPDKTVKFRL